MQLDYLILAGILAAIYGGMKVIMDTVYVTNDKFHLLLDIDEDGSRLDRSRKCHILTTIVRPLINGLKLFVAVYTLGFFVLAGLIVWSGSAHWAVAALSVCAGLASCYALYIIHTKNKNTLAITETYLRQLPDKKDGLAPIDCCRKRSNGLMSAAQDRHDAGGQPQDLTGGGNLVRTTEDSGRPAPPAGVGSNAPHL